MKALIILSLALFLTIPDIAVADCGEVACVDVYTKDNQIIIEARDFLEAIASGTPKWPSFADGHLVNQVIAAAWASQSHAQRQRVTKKFNFEFV